MIQVVKNQCVKENEAEEVKQVKKEFSTSTKAIRRVLLAGVGTELIVLCNHGYNFYKSGIGIALNLPYVNTVIPYWFIALAILSPTSAYFYKWYKKLYKSTLKSENKDDLISMWSKKYGNDK